MDNIAGKEPILGLVCQRDGEDAAIIPSHFDELETDNQVLVERDRSLVVHRCSCCEGPEHSQLSSEEFGVGPAVGLRDVAPGVGRKNEGISSLHLVGGGFELRLTILTT